MDLTKYQELSRRTRSPVSKVEINPVLLMNTLNMFVHSARLLEHFKKFIFYGKPFVKNDIVHALRNIAESHRRLQFTSTEPADQSLMVQPLNIDPDFFHAIIGIATEAGELVEHLKFDGSPLDRTGIADELGDQHWYQAFLVDSLSFDWESVLTANVEKLQKRYPTKFTSEDAIHRDRAAERDAIENNVVDNGTKPKKVVKKKSSAVKKAADGRKRVSKKNQAI